MLIELPDLVRILAKASLEGDEDAIAPLHDLLIELGVPSDHWTLSRFGIMGDAFDSRFYFRCFWNSWKFYDTAREGFI